VAKVAELKCTWRSKDEIVRQACKNEQLDETEQAMQEAGLKILKHSEHCLGERERSSLQKNKYYAKLTPRDVRGVAGRTEYLRGWGDSFNLLVEWLLKKKSYPKKADDQKLHKWMGTQREDKAAAHTKNKTVLSASREEKLDSIPVELTKRGLTKEEAAKLGWVWGRTNRE
jgi:hypothetical protein